MAAIEPLNLSCISGSMSLVRRSVAEYILGAEYGMTVMVFVSVAV